METARGEGQKLVPLLKRLLNENSVPQLCWEDKEQGIWRLPWRIHKRTVWGDPDAYMLLEIAKCLYGHTDAGEPKKGQLKYWKELLRNALRSLKKDVKEMETLHMQEGDSPYKVYQFLKNDHKGVRKGQQKKTTNLRGTNGDSDPKGQQELPTTCGFSPGFASNSESSFQFSDNSQNIQASTNLVVPFNVSQQFSSARNSAFQHYNQMSAVPTHLLNDLNHVTFSPRYHILPSTSCSIDDHPAATGINAHPLDQLVSELNIFDECMPQLGENTYRSRSPLSNGNENLGNIPLFLKGDATEVENDGTHVCYTELPSTKQLEPNTSANIPLRPVTKPTDSLYYACPIENNSHKDNHWIKQITGDNLLFNNLGCDFYEGNALLEGNSNEEHVLMHRGNVVTQQENVLLHRGNVVTQQENVLLHRGNVVTQQENVLLHRGNVVTQQENIVPHQDNIVPGQSNFVTQGSNLDRYQHNTVLHQKNVMPHQRIIVPHQRNIGFKQGNCLAPQLNILSQRDNLVLQQCNSVLQQCNYVLPDGNYVLPDGNSVLPDDNFGLPDGNSVLPDGNFGLPGDTFGLHQENIVPHQRYISGQKGNIVPQEGNYVLQDGNTMSHEGTMVTQRVCPATYNNNTTVSGGLTVASNSSSQSCSRSLVIAGGSFPREHPSVAPNMLNLGSRLNIPQILNSAPRKSLVVIAYYYLAQPVKIQPMTGKFRICFVADDDARESIRNCLSPQQFGPTDVEMFELPEVDEVSKRKAEARDTQKVLNNLSRGIIIDYRSEDIYATRYCKAVPQFCNPETTQFTKMERLQEVKIFDFQNTLILSRDHSFRYQTSKPCARLVFAVKDANTRQSVLTVDIWHKEAYQMTQAVAENGSSMEADCSMSDEYDNRMSIEQKLKKYSPNFYTSSLVL